MRHTRPPGKKTIDIVFDGDIYYLQGASEAAIVLMERLCSVSHPSNHWEMEVAFDCVDGRIAQDLV